MTDTEIQAEAEAYQAEFAALEAESHELGARRSRNRQRGLRLLAAMRLNGINTLTVGRVVLSRQPDDSGFQRIRLDRPSAGPPMPSPAPPQNPHASAVLKKIDTAPIAPRAALAELTDPEALLVANLAAEALRAAQSSPPSSPTRTQRQSSPPGPAPGEGG